MTTAARTRPAERVARLVFANWLAHADRPRADRPRLVGNAPQYAAWHVYAGDPGVPYAARAIEPEKLFRWLESTALRWRFLPSTMFAPPDPDAERRHHADLLVALAERLYRLETGRDAASVEALVPRYLKVVPASYASPAPSPPAR